MRALRNLAIALGFVWASAEAQPIISSLSPPSAPAGTPGLTLTVNGSGFVSGAALSWGNNYFITSFRSITPTMIVADVPAALLTNPSTVFVSVVNPGNLRSSPALFVITQVQLTISPDALPQASVGTAYSAQLTATGGTPPVTWSIASGTLPPGITLAPSTGVLSGIPTLAGTYNFSVLATDSAAHTGTKAYTIVVTPPVLAVVTESPLPPATAGRPYTTTLAATGGSGSYQWSVSGLPVWLTLDPARGVLAGTPPTPGNLRFTVQVTDGSVSSTPKIFELVVNPPPVAITTVSPLFSGTAGSPYTQTFSAAGGTPPYRWTLVSGDPAGLTLSEAGVLSGTPRSTGDFPFVVQVTDSTGGAAQSSFVLSVNPPTLTITPGPALPAGTALVPYTQNFTVVGGTAPYTWQLVSGAVPGLTFAPGTAILSGTPTTSGTYNLTLLVRDAAGVSATRTFTLTIGPPALRVTAADLPNATLNLPFEFAIAATGGAPPYTWSATGLPEGLSIDAATGRISGIPTAAGTFSFTARATDSARSTAVELFRLVVSLPPPPALSVSGLPETAQPADQMRLQVSIAAPYDVPISGQAVLTFAPDAGLGDETIQFAGGGRTVDFTIQQGSREPASLAPLAIQTGTIAGTVTVSVRLRAGGTDIAQSSVRTRIERSAPVIRSARLVRSSNGFSIEITGYATSREVTQASFSFSAASGQSLLTSTVNVPVEELFSRWFQDTSSARFGSQFVFTQPFTVQGDPTAVLPDRVTLTNRVGSSSIDIARQ